MNSIFINKYEYVLSDDLFIKAPIYCKESRNARELIRKNKITDFVFAKPDDKNNWSITNGKSYKYDKILLKKSFVNTIKELIDDKPVIVDNIESAPKIINLLDNEKFQDNDGNIIDIETRGERTVDKIYFKVKDVMKGFEMDCLLTTIIDNRKDNYTENTHYKYFNVKKTLVDKKIKIKKELYLTYEGILRVLFVSHSPKCKTFVKWAVEKLFVLQMGTKEQKQDLVSSVLGVNAKNIKEVFNTSARQLPVVYLFTFGYVKDLRISMNISSTYNDNDIVAKYGFTKDITRRTSEHMAYYGKIKNCDLKLKFHSYIDPQYLSDAENDIKNFINALKINYDNELIIIPNNLLNIIEKQYQQISSNYMGHISELVTKIKELENQILVKNLDIDLINERHKNELQSKDIEMLNYKIKLLEGLS
jgi:hypothetical protein